MFSFPRTYYAGDNDPARKKKIPICLPQNLLPINEFFLNLSRVNGVVLHWLELETWDTAHDTLMVEATVCLKAAGVC